MAEIELIQWPLSVTVQNLKHFHIPTHATSINPVLESHSLSLTLAHSDLLFLDPFLPESIIKMKKCQKDSKNFYFGNIDFFFSFLGLFEPN